jgi:hypothetical protein
MTHSAQKTMPSPPREAIHKVTYDGKPLEVELQLNPTAREVYSLISILESVKQALKE